MEVIARRLQARRWPPVVELHAAGGTPVRRRAGQSLDAAREGVGHRLSTVELREPAHIVGATAGAAAVRREQDREGAREPPMKPVLASPAAAAAVRLGVQDFLYSVTMDADARRSAGVALGHTGSTTPRDAGIVPALVRWLSRSSGCKRRKSGGA